MLRERLPTDISSLLTDDPPELLDGEFIDEALQGSQSDRLFRARLKAGGEAIDEALAAIPEGEEARQIAKRSNGGVWNAPNRRGMNAIRALALARHLAPDI